ncbi:MAG TPA: tetratricopeptide repeat protein, partial [Myxococcaceae bacterium]|nr:tetratricopeptide repeat protein [Myxococcaceae bacterium]
GAAAQRGIQQAFEATGKSFAPEAWRATREQLDGWTHRWRQAREQACDASALRTGEGARRLERRLTCLDRRLDEFSTLTGALASADADLVARASAAAAGLSDLSACSETRSLSSAREALPPAQQAVFKELDAHLARARGLNGAGKTRQAIEEIEPALASAKALGFQPALIDPELALGRFTDTAHQFAKSKEAYTQAAQAAQASGNDEQLAAALVEMVNVVGSGLAHEDEALTLASLARGTFQRLGGSASLERQLLHTLGDVDWRVGKNEQAIQSLRSAMAVEVSASSAEDMEASHIHYDLGWVLMEAGRLDEAEQEENRALSLKAAVVGEKNPSLSSIWNALGSIAAEKGDDAQAVQRFEKALELRESAADPNHPNLVAPLSNLGQELIMAGQSARALPYIERARSILAAQTETSETDTSQVEEYRALALRKLGRPAEALASSEHALARMEHAMPKDAVALVSPLREKALDLVDLGRCAEALGLFERALAIAAKDSQPFVGELSAETASALLCLERWEEARVKLEKAVPLLDKKSRRAVLAEAQLRMAEALWHTPAEKERALEFARQAAGLEGVAGGEQVREQARAWLTRHAP